MTKLIFLDTETTGLDPKRHEVWEIAYVEHGMGNSYDAGFEFQVWPDLTLADPNGLRVSKFYDRERMSQDDGQVAPALMRYTEWSDKDAAEHQDWTPTTPEHIASLLAHVFDGAHIIGACPWFDDAMISKFLRRWGQAATWHYHLIDVEAMAVGYLARAGTLIDPPYRSDELASLIGIPPIEERLRHTALGDALWVRSWWNAMRKDAKRPKTVSS